MSYQKAAADLIDALAELFKPVTDIVRGLVDRLNQWLVERKAARHAKSAFKSFDSAGLAFQAFQDAGIDFSKPLEGEKLLLDANGNPCQIIWLGEKVSKYEAKLKIVGTGYESCKETDTERTEAAKSRSVERR